MVQKTCRTINDYPAVLNSGLPTLGAIVRKFGFDATQAYLEGWIVNIREFINVGKKMQDRQTPETAMLILETYPSLNIADINLVFKKAKLGDFGQIYDRLDGQIILSWFNQYFQERCRVAADQSIREADNYKADSSTQTFDQIVNLNKKLKR